MKRLPRLIVLAPLIFAVMPVQAARYELKEGHKYALCRDYEANLNRFSDEWPMLCERKLDPDFSDFRKPKWTELDPKEHLGFLRAINLYRDGKFTRPGTKERFDEPGPLRLSRATIDVDHNGVPETVFRVARLPCEPTRESFESWGGIAKLQLDAAYTHYVMDESEKPVKKFRVLSSWPSGVFYYKGRVYEGRVHAKPVPVAKEESKRLKMIVPDATLSVTEFSEGVTGTAAIGVCMFDIFYDFETE